MAKLLSCDIQIVSGSTFDLKIKKNKTTFQNIDESSFAHFHRSDSSLRHFNCDTWYYYERLVFISLTRSVFLYRQIGKFLKKRFDSNRFSWENVEKARRRFLNRPQCISYCLSFLCWIWNLYFLVFIEMFCIAKIKKI